MLASTTPADILHRDFVLIEDESAVRQPLKEAFLALRIAAESANIFDEGSAQEE
jgi:hypothetical protein